MKKTYQTPVSYITEAELQQLMVASNNYGSPELGQDLGKVEETTATNGNLSRRSSVWDYDEDGEEF